MLSRLSATRSTALLQHILRPCVVASTTSSRNFSLSTRVDNKLVHGAWYNKAWPSYKLYKEMAGESAGPVFFIGLSSYLLSKEIYVVNDEVLLIFVMGSVVYHLCRTVGPPIGKALADRRETIIREMYQGKQLRMDMLEQNIVNEKEGDAILEKRAEIVEIALNREEMKLELEYRRRLQEVESEVKKRLDYQVDLQNLKRGIEQRHMASWVENEVLKSITDEQEEDALLQCIRDLNGLADAKAMA